MANRQYLKWKPDEVSFLLEHYGPEGVQFCADALNRPVTSITTKAKALKLRTSDRRHCSIIREISETKD